MTNHCNKISQAPLPNRAIVIVYMFQYYVAIKFVFNNTRGTTMKKTLLAIALALSATASQAALVTLTDSNFSLTFEEMPFDLVGSHDVIDVNGADATQAFTGQLSAITAGDFLVTFLGKEAAFTNFYVYNGVTQLTMSSNDLSPGDDFVFSTGAGLINFGFSSDNGTPLNLLDDVTGSNINNYIGRIAYLPNDGSYKDANGVPFSVLIGFNDGSPSDADYDDYVIGISAVSAVPVPAALPLMATALGAFGIARRRNKAKAA